MQFMALNYRYTSHLSLKIPGQFYIWFFDLSFFFFLQNYLSVASNLISKYLLFIATNGTASFTFLTYQRFYFLLSQQWYQPLSSVSELERTVHV